MSMKIKAIILLVIFGAILYLPFSIHAVSGNIFNGLPIPVLNTLGATEGNGASGDQYATMDQYAQGLPKPSVPVQVDLDYMRNHMNILKQEGQNAKSCAACHTNRAEFCDRCHSYVGINPSFDY